jgi:hypothetical protein
MGRRNPPALILDFSGRRPAPGFLGWVLLGIGLAAAGLELYEWRAGEADLGEREAIVERLRHQTRRSAPLQAASPRPPVSEQEARPALRLASQLGADWGGLLHELAAAEDERVALLNLEVEAARGSLRLVGDAKSLEAVFDYLARLEASPALGAARLNGYERVAVGAVEVVRFNASAEWEGRP